MNKTVVISFKTENKQETKVLAVDIDEKIPKVQVKDSCVLAENYYEAIVQGNVEKLVAMLEEILNREDMQKRFFHVLLPDELIQIQCYQIPLETLPDNKEKNLETDGIKEICLKKYQKEVNQASYNVTIMRKYVGEKSCYITCAFISQKIIDKIQEAFQSLNLAVYYLEPQIYSIGALIYDKYPQGNVIFKEDAIYYLFSQEGMLALKALAADEQTNCQLLLALEQKTFESKGEKQEKLRIVRTEDFYLLPDWVEQAVLLNPTLVIYGLAGPVVRSAAWNNYRKTVEQTELEQESLDKDGGKNQIGRIRKFFKRKKEKN